MVIYFIIHTISPTTVPEQRDTTQRQNTVNQSKGGKCPVVVSRPLCTIVGLA